MEKNRENKHQGLAQEGARRAHRSQCPKCNQGKTVDAMKLSWSVLNACIFRYRSYICMLFAEPSDLAILLGYLKEFNNSRGAAPDAIRLQDSGAALVVCEYPNEILQFSIMYLNFPREVWGADMAKHKHAVN